MRLDIVEVIIQVMNEIVRKNNGTRSIPYRVDRLFEVKNRAFILSISDFLSFIKLIFILLPLTVDPNISTSFSSLYTIVL